VRCETKKKRKKTILTTGEKNLVFLEEGEVRKMHSQEEEKKTVGERERCSDLTLKESSF